MSNRLVIVFAIDHYNPLGMVRSLGEKGINPILIAEKGRATLASKSKYISKCHFVDTLEEGYELLLKEYGNEEVKPFLLCCDDHTQGFLDERYEEIKDKFVFFNAGRNNGINKYMDKYEILMMAKECGIESAPTVRCKWGEIPEGLKYPVITKSISPNVGGWKSDVHICQSEEELRNAYNNIKAPEIIIQKYIEKKNELEYYGISINHGEEVMISIAANYLYLIPGYYSPYMNIFEPPFPELQEKIKLLFKKIGFEGIFSIEFVVDENDNKYFLEVNFRNATWSYSSTVAGMDLPYLWVKSMEEGHIPADAKKPFDRFHAMVEPIDYGKRVDTGKATLAEWLGDFKEAKCTYYYNKDDIEPFNELRKDWDSLK